jgi:hypothetical protein
MSRLIARFAAPLLAAIAVAACASTMGAPREIETPTVALRVDPDATAADIVAALRDARARAVFLTADRDDAWFAGVAAATGLHVTGPATFGPMRTAFLAPEALGDTIYRLPYEGGAITLLDALYEVDEDRFLDLMAFRIQAGDAVRPIMTALLEYVATDVGNDAALVMAVTVPDEAVGDSVARMLSPAYSDARRCGAEATTPPAGERTRLFYGPSARMFCTTALARNTALGEWVQAQLVMGRR